MNNKRRKELDRVFVFASNVFNNIGTEQNKYNIIKSLQNIVDDLKDIQRDEEYYMYNIPDNLQGGIRYTVAEEACDNMEMAISYLNDIIEDEECTLKEISDTLALSIKYIILAAA